MDNEKLESTPEINQNSEKNSSLKDKFNTTVSALKSGANTGVTILNGIIGDYLHKAEASLAIQMQFYKDKKPVILNRESLINYNPTLSSKICILIHGLVCNELVWNYHEEEKNYGTLLEKDFGVTPFYLRYNSGLHISENGKSLSLLIENLLKEYPKEIEEITIIGHSMGGLVTRSACHYGSIEKREWVSKVKKLFFLGSPHLGAPMEKFGNIITNVLEQIPNPFVHLAKNIINQRSAGIKDLRYGYLLEEDWEGKDPDLLLQNNKNEVPLLDGVQYYVITGTITENPKHPISEWFGDAIVRKQSALGKSKNPEHVLSFSEDNHKEFPGIFHLKLMHRDEIYEQIKLWYNIV
jgi:pimeloyl-ACP methyl ester carboxylesterase